MFDVHCIVSFATILYYGLHLVNSEIKRNNIEKQDILRKKYPYNCFVMTMHQSLHADGTSVSTFLCTRKLGPEEVSSLQAVHRN